MSEKQWSPVPQIICEFCAWVWVACVFGICTYIVFWLDRSGWWYLLAIVIAGFWGCNNTLSPEAMRAYTEMKKAENEDEE